MISGGATGGIVVSCLGHLMSYPTVEWAKVVLLIVRSTLPANSWLSHRNQLRPVAHPLPSSCSWPSCFSSYRPAVAA